MTKKRITQIEIAKAVGVSQRAVATVVGRTGSKHGAIVSEATRQKILETAARLGYRPQRQAQLLRGVKSGVIGVIKSITSNQSGVERHYHASLALHREGYGILAQEMLWGDAQDAERAVETLLDAGVEGVLLGVGSPPVSARLQRAGLPVVSLGGAKFPHFPYVGADHGHGMRLMVEHLLSLGHRKLAFEIGLSPQDTITPTNWSLHARLNAFRESCAKAGLDESEAIVLWQPRRLPSFDEFQFGQHAARTLIERGELPDALICQNDLHATGAQKVFFDHGITIPETMALAGFDNTAIGQQLRTPLTTVALPLVGMANLAVESLISLIREEASAASLARETLLPCELIIRDSCGASARKLPRNP